VQALVLVPSRELAIQIEQVARNMGAGFKINAVYGGRPFSKDKLELKSPPQILIGTPGRVGDHLRRETFDPNSIKNLVLDEFDKSLEVGFEEQMKEILFYVPNIKKKILTSATQGIEVPDFVKLKDPQCIDYLEEKLKALKVKIIVSSEKDKLYTLIEALCHLGNQPGIIFCNFKESIARVSDFLDRYDISHGTFHGGMDQIDRERSLIKFRNGTHQLIVATDLAARGLDIPEIKFIIHYHLPIKSQEFTHRNGRTARMHNEGTAYVLKWEEEELPDFIESPDYEVLESAEPPNPSAWKTIFISGGRKDKISKGDIAGLLFKKVGLSKEEVGIIELKQDCAFVAIKADKIEKTVTVANNQRLKKKKVRVKLI